MKTYSYEELQTACEQHGSKVKNKKGIEYAILNFDDCGISIEGVAHEVTYEDLLYYYRWADDNSSCGIEGDDAPKDTSHIVTKTRGKEVKNEVRGTMNDERGTMNNERGMVFVPVGNGLYARGVVCGYYKGLAVVGYDTDNGVIAKFNSGITGYKSYDLAEEQSLMYAR